MSDRAFRVLFLCTGNSCRSQMAEALARTVGRDLIESFSAGAAPRPVHPLAVRVMSEIGIDITDQTSKSLETFAGQAFDFVITVCVQAKESCPTLPTAREHIYWRVDDPVEALGDEVERVKVFRRVREELRHRIQLFLLANRKRAGK
jgi:arsenate reductase (thioredoxin)